MSELSAPPSSAPVSDATAVPPPKILLLIFSITLTGIMANTMVVPAIPDILDTFGRPDSSAGLFVAAATLPGIVMAPIIGVLADRHGRRLILIPCLVGFGVFGALNALAPTWELLLLSRVLQGVGAAGLINLGVVLISDHWTGVERAKRMGQNAAVLTVALAVFPALGGALTELGGWRVSFTPYAIGLVTAAIVWRRLDATRPAAPPPMRAQLGAARTAILHRDVLGSISIGMVMFFLIFGLFLTAMPVHLEREFGLTAGTRGLIVAVPAVSSTVAALRLGRWRGRFGAVAIITAAGALFATGFLLMGLAASLPLLVAGTVFYGLGEGILMPTLQDVVAGVAPPDQRGAVVAVWVGAARGGQTIGPLIVGALYGALGTGPTFLIGAGVALTVVVAELAGRFGDDHRALRSTAAVPVPPA